MDAWPAGHSIGVYLSVDHDMRPIGTARTSQDVPGLLRKLADSWEAYGSLPIPATCGDVYFTDLLWEALDGSR